MGNKYLAALASAVFMFPFLFSDIATLTKRDNTGRFLTPMPVANAERSGAGDTFIGYRSPSHLVQRKTADMARLWTCNKRVLVKSLHRDTLLCLDQGQRLHSRL